MKNVNYDHLVPQKLYLKNEGLKRKKFWTKNVPHVTLLKNDYMTNFSKMHPKAAIERWTQISRFAALYITVRYNTPQKYVA